MTTTEDLSAYLQSTDVIDWRQPNVIALAAELRCDQPVETARRSFEWVRDGIKHSFDYQLNPVTCTASETLLAGTGYCFAKSHLLAALLRANGIPAGLCYQWLADDDDTSTFSLHGLNAVWLSDIGWYRIDARGNKAGVDAQFCPPVEKLAWSLDHAGERDLPGVYAEPPAEVVEALRVHETWDAFAAALPAVGLPAAPSGDGR